MEHSLLLLLLLCSMKQHSVDSFISFKYFSCFFLLFFLYLFSNGDVCTISDMETVLPVYRINNFSDSLWQSMQDRIQSMSASGKMRSQPINQWQSKMMRKNKSHDDENQLKTYKTLLMSLSGFFKVFFTFFYFFFSIYLTFLNLFFFSD